MASHFIFSDFALHTASRTLLWRDAAVAIEPKVFDVLAYLVEHRARAVGRDELIAAVWGRVDVSDATLQQAISRLRRALRETPETPFVRTVPRHGYQWVAATQLAAPPPVDVAPVASVVPDAAPPQTAVPAAVAREPRRSRPALPWLAAAAMLMAGALVVGRRVGNEAAPAPPREAASAVTSPPRECPREASVEDCQRKLSALLARGTLSARERAPLLLERAEQSLRTAALDDAARDLDAVDQQAAQLPPELVARSLFLRHRIAVAAGRPDDAMAFGQRALAIYRSQGPSDAYAELLHSLGAVAGRRGELERAQAWLDAALPIYDLTRNDEGAARVLATRAYTLSQQGRFAESLSAARAAQARAAAQPSAEVRREALIALAWSSIQNGRLNEAREAVHAALDLPGTAGNAPQSVSLHALLGFIDAAGGRFAEALSAWDDALALAPENPQSAASAGLRLAMVYAALQAGDRARAQQHFEQLQRMAGQAPPLQPSARHAAALIALADGDDDQAARLFADVWSSARASGSINQQMLADYADLLLRRRDLDTLEALLGEPSLPAQEGYLYQLVQARYLATRGRREDARAAFDRARALAGERYSHWLDVTRREVMAGDGPR